MSLQPFSDAYRKAALEQNKQDLRQITKEEFLSFMPTNAAPTNPFGLLFNAVNFLTSEATLLVLKHFFGYDPFEWVAFKNDKNYTAEFANRESNRDLAGELDEAGALFIQNNKCPPLNIHEHKFDEVIQGAGDVVQIVSDISKITRNVKEGVIINLDDITNAISESIKSLLRSTEADGTVRTEYSSPIVSEKFKYGWIKFEFRSKLTIRESCCSKQKRISVDEKIYFYQFSNRAEFDGAVARAKSRK